MNKNYHASLRATSDRRAPKFFMRRRWREKLRAYSNELIEQKFHLDLEQEQQANNSTPDTTRREKPILTRFTAPVLHPEANAAKDRNSFLGKKEEVAAWASAEQKLLRREFERIKMQETRRANSKNEEQKPRDNAHKTTMSCIRELVQGLLLLHEQKYADIHRGRPPKMVGYINTSMLKPKHSRQLRDFLYIGININNIYVDHGASGKDFDRVEYRRMCQGLRMGDILVIHNLNRLGTNCIEVLHQWQKMKARDISIVSLDMPHLLHNDRRYTSSEVMYSRFKLMIRSFEAEKERLNILKRKQQIRDIIRKATKRKGRPTKPLPKGFKAALARYQKGEYSGVMAAFFCNMPWSTFYHKAQIIMQDAADLAPDDLT